MRNEYDYLRETIVAFVSECQKVRAPEEFTIRLWLRSRVDYSGHTKLSGSELVLKESEIDLIGKSNWDDADGSGRLTICRDGFLYSDQYKYPHGVYTTHTFLNYSDLSEFVVSPSDRSLDIDLDQRANRFLEIAMTQTMKQMQSGIIEKLSELRGLLQSIETRVDSISDEVSELKKWKATEMHDKGFRKS